MPSCRVRVVAGDHQDAYARTQAAGNSLQGFGAGRIDHALEPEKGHAAGDILLRHRQGLRGHVLHGEGQNAQSFPGELPGDARQRPAERARP